MNNQMTISTCLSFITLNGNELSSPSKPIGWLNRQENTHTHTEKVKDGKGYFIQIKKILSWSTNTSYQTKSTLKQKLWEMRKGWRLSWLQHCPVHQNVVGSIPVRAHTYVMGSVLGQGAYGRQPIDASLSHLSLSLFLCLCLPPPSSVSTIN